MYWCTRSVMTSHAAMTTMTVMKAVSRHEPHRDAVDTQVILNTLKRSIHEKRFSSNCDRRGGHCRSA